MNCILVYITASNEKEARKLAQILLEKKLIACANYVSGTSLYYWENKIKETPEVIIICKTTESHYPALEKEVLRIHSYHIPCILKLKASPTAQYGQWLLDSVRKR